MVKNQTAYRVLKTSNIDGIGILKGSIVRLKPSVAKHHIARGNIRKYK